MEQLLPADFTDKFPEDITISQSIATWKTAVMYQQQTETEV